MTAVTEKTTKTDMVCKTCRSRNVRRDANAMWNRSAQRWELAGLYDQGSCGDCGGETTIEEIPLN